MSLNTININRSYFGDTDKIRNGNYFRNGATWPTVFGSGETNYDKDLFDDYQGLTEHTAGLCTNWTGEDAIMVWSKDESKTSSDRVVGCIQSSDAMTSSFPIHGEGGAWDGSRGVLCPGATDSFWTSGTPPYELRCTYDNISAEKLQEIDRLSINAASRGVYNEIKNEYCQPTIRVKGDDELDVTAGKRLTHVISDDGKTCGDLDSSNKVLEAHCGKGDNLFTDTTTCVPGGESGLTNQLYDKLGEKYCKEHPNSKKYCSCYNVTAGVCDTLPTAAGCALWDENKKDMISLVGNKNASALFNKPGCSASACMGSDAGTYRSKTNPDAYTCTNNINICSMDIDVGAATDSPLIANCDIEQNIIDNDTTITAADGSGSGAGAAGAADPPPEDEDESNIMWIVALIVLLVCLCMGLAGVLGVGAMFALKK